MSTHPDTACVRRALDSLEGLTDDAIRKNPGAVRQSVESLVQQLRPEFLSVSLTFHLDNTPDSLDELLTWLDNQPDQPYHAVGLTASTISMADDAVSKGTMSQHLRDKIADALRGSPDGIAIDGVTARMLHGARMEFIGSHMLDRIEELTGEPPF